MTPRNGFTLIELLVVSAIMAVLVALFAPVVSKVRASANSAACLANLNHLGMTFAIYTAENGARLPHYMWNHSPEVAWNGYWLGIADAQSVRGEAVLCRAAREPLAFNLNHGYGNARHAWTGKYSANGTVVRFSETNYRRSSYGFNRYLTAESAFNDKVTRLHQVKQLSFVPVFFDSAWVDAKPENGSATAPAEAPPDLTGGHSIAGTPDHWRFLLARHGRAINMSFADGSARLVSLGETYTLIWNGKWVRYVIPLP